MPAHHRLPPWFKVPAPGGVNYRRLKGLMRSEGLHTICEEAHCPNIGECWEAGVATFLILGETCTRACGFCAVKTGRPDGIDLLEPLRVAQAARRLSLRHVVITSVDRDDLADGGAHLFAQTVSRVRRAAPETRIEVLTPDFKGDPAAIDTVAASQPDVFAHNVETPARLYRRVRPGSRYRRSLEVLERVKARQPDTLTKSNIMVGLGERWEEVVTTMRDLVAHGVDILTVGQYLRPSPAHLPVDRFYDPGEFRELKAIGEDIGFRHVEAGALVRSSYHAERHVPAPPAAGGGTGIPA